MPPERPLLFDFDSARLRRARARRINAERFLDAMAAEGLADRLAAVTRTFAQALAVGDAVPAALHGLAGRWTVADFDRREILDLPEASFDLAVSLFSLQAINDLPGALVQVRRALRPDGLFLGAILGGATLNELRESFAVAESETTGGVSPRVSPFGDVRDMGGLLQRAGFALPVADVERTLVRYGDFSALVRDLRAHGLTNMLAQRRRTMLARRTLAALLAQYRGRHGDGGKLNATFEIVYLTGWAPHQSQQQPLKPGSAKTRLAEALGTAERGAGEKTGR